MENLDDRDAGCFGAIDVQESFRNRPYWLEEDVPAFIERQQALIDGGLTRNRIRRVIISINQFSKCLWCGSNPPACRAVECTPFIGVGEWSIPGAGGSAPLL